MEGLHGTASWPGVIGCITCTYTCVDGATPGIASFTAPRQDISKIARIGTLTIWDNVNPRLELKNCLLDRIDVSLTGSMMTLTIVDRRWKWRHKKIDGWYNQVSPNPTPDEFDGALDDVLGEFIAYKEPFIPGTERHIRLLMKLCLEALGERSDATAFVGEVPDRAFPAIDWKAENPARALQMLTDAISWRICYQPFPDDRIVLSALNSPIVIPNLPIKSHSPGLNPADPPRKAVGIGAPILLADYLPLEPVGIEPNGEVVPIDELTFRPVTGWNKGSFPGQWNKHTVPEGACESTQQAADLANRHVYRTFRIKCSDKDQIEVSSIVFGDGKPVDVTKELADIANVTDRRQLILMPQVYTSDKDASGQYVTERPKIGGEFYDRMRSWGGNAVNSASGLTEDITIDTVRGLVHSSAPLFRIVGSGADVKWEPPIIRVYTSFQVRYRETNSPICWEQIKDFGRGIDIDPEVVRRPEIALIAWVERSTPPNFTVVQKSSNIDEVKNNMEYFLNASRYRYQDEKSLATEYVGIHQLKVGGCVRQVTWSIGSGPPVTTMSINTESATYIPPYAERRRFIMVDWARGNQA